MKQLLILIGIGCLLACSKEKVQPYNDVAGIAFYIKSDGTEADSISYSFALQAGEKERDTIFVKMRIVGSPSATDREIKVKAAPGTTATEGKDYIFPAINMPAGSSTVLYPIVLLKSDRLDTETVRLVAEISGNKDFEPGATGRETGGTINIHTYTIDFNNQLIMPGYWGLIDGYFGSFSITRYKFMISVFGTADFAPVEAGGKLTYADMINYPVKLRNALAAYEAVNGPLIDEFGNRVTF
jgi:hypothetical protein